MVFFFPTRNTKNNSNKTRLVIHVGPVINLISTIDIYDKFVIARGKIKTIYFNVHHVVVKGKKS
jgi:hypothetical protein